jgi:integrase
LDNAFENELIVKNPAKKSGIGGMEGRQTRKFLNYEEWKLLLGVLGVTRLEETMIYLAATTGLGYGELVGLTANDLDWKRNTISINKTWDYKYGAALDPLKMRHLFELLLWIKQQ